MRLLDRKTLAISTALVICLTTACESSSNNKNSSEPAKTAVSGIVRFSGGPPAGTGDDAIRPAANAQVEVRQGEAIIATVSADSHGKFSTSLEPGNYTFNAKTGGSGYCGDPVSVEVKDAQSSAVDINCPVG